MAYGSSWRDTGIGRSARRLLTGDRRSSWRLKLSPHIVVLDLALPALNGLEATRQIKKALPNTKVLIFTMHQPEQLTRDVLGAGARAYLLKSDASCQVVDAVEALAKHKPYFTWKVSNALLDAYLKHGPAHEKTPGFNRLTAREREIVQLLAEGAANKAVSALSASASRRSTRTAMPSWRSWVSTPSPS